jgi:nitrous oxidase accessory protein NosD
LLRAAGVVLVASVCLASAVLTWQHFDWFGPPIPRRALLVEGLIAGLSIIAVRAVDALRPGEPARDRPAPARSHRGRGLGPSQRFGLGFVLGAGFAVGGGLGVAAALWRQGVHGDALRTVVTVDATGRGAYPSISAGLRALGPTGGTIQVLRGDYPGGFVVPANTTLRGEPGVRVLAPLGWRRNAIEIQGDGVTLEGLEIDGRRDLQPWFQSAQNLSGILVHGRAARIRNCHIHSTRNMGIFARGEGAADLWVEDCVIENSAVRDAPGGTPGYHLAGIMCMGTPRPVIRRNRIRGWSQAVGLWYGVYDGLVEENELLDNYGFYDPEHRVGRSAGEDYGATAPGHGRNRWLGNRIDGSTACCLEIAAGVIGSEYRGNVLTNAGRMSDHGGPWVVKGVPGQPTREILIADNDIRSPGTRAESCVIWGGDTSEITVRGNRFSGFSHPEGLGPILVSQQAGPRGLTIAGNEFVTSRLGIAIAADPVRATIQGNRFSPSVGSEPGIALLADTKPAVADNWEFSGKPPARPRAVRPVRVALPGRRGGHEDVLRPPLVFQPPGAQVSPRAAPPPATPPTGVADPRVGAQPELPVGATRRSP